MMKNIKKLTWGLGYLVLVASSAFAQTQVQNAPGSFNTSINSASGLLNLITSIIGWVQVIFFTVAALFIILAAFQYLTSGGDAEKRKEAQDKIVYAIIAIVIAALAFGVKAIVVSILS
jgi:uncharacterized membrane protein